MITGGRWSSSAANSVPKPTWNICSHSIADRLLHTLDVERCAIFLSKEERAGGRTQEFYLAQSFNLGIGAGQGLDLRFLGRHRPE